MKAHKRVVDIIPNLNVTSDFYYNMMIKLNMRRVVFTTLIYETMNELS